MSSPKILVKNNFIIQSKQYIHDIESEYKYVLETISDAEILCSMRNR